MPSTNERLDALENVAVKLASNKIDTADHNAHIAIENTRYLDLKSALLDLLARIQAIEEWIINNS